LTSSEDIHPFWKEALSDDAIDERESGESANGIGQKQTDLLKKDLTLRKRQWRISQEEVERFRAVMKAYLGTQ
jgi:hypothetical protein